MTAQGLAFRVGRSQHQESVDKQQTCGHEQKRIGIIATLKSYLLRQSLSHTYTISPVRRLGGGTVQRWGEKCHYALSTQVAACLAKLECYAAPLGAFNLNEAAGI